MKEVSQNTFDSLCIILNISPIRILESCNLYHFYFEENKNGFTHRTSYTYTKDDIIRLSVKDNNVIKLNNNRGIK